MTEGWSGPGKCAGPVLSSLSSYLKTTIKKNKNKKKKSVLLETPQGEEPVLMVLLCLEQFVSFRHTMGYDNPEEPHMSSLTVRLRGPQQQRTPGKGPSRTKSPAHCYGSYRTNHHAGPLPARSEGTPQTISSSLQNYQESLQGMKDVSLLVGGKSQ